MSDSVTPWTAAHQAPPSMGPSRQEHWSGVPLPSRLQWLKYLSANAGSTGSSPGWGTKITRAMRCGQKIKKTPNILCTLGATTEWLNNKNHAPFKNINNQPLLLIQKGYSFLLMTNVLSWIKFHHLFLYFFSLSEIYLTQYNKARPM